MPTHGASGGYGTPRLTERSRRDGAADAGPGLRLLVAWAPWLAFAVAVTDMALWWTQRPWAMRLAGCGMLAAWLLAWNWRACQG